MSRFVFSVDSSIRINAFLQSHMLRELYLHDNRIDSLSGEQFKGLKNLKVNVNSTEYVWMEAHSFLNEGWLGATLDLKTYGTTVFSVGIFCWHREIHWT